MKTIYVVYEKSFDSDSFRILKSFKTFKIASEFAIDHQKYLNTVGHNYRLDLKQGNFDYLEVKISETTLE